MSQAIVIDHISKVYQLGTISTGTFGEDLSRWWARIRRKPDPLLAMDLSHHERQVGQQYWALDDVSFSLSEGEVLGVIGRNGAGKSTLLKILSQVTSPSSGSIRIKGRVASLLEVGTGFHPDLTGRENVFLNGAILGMTKEEIRRNFDEIVAFSECEAFIDTPVKRYSSGMYVRLAFAVAAHLEPEILIVDEVLAVGDAQFQRKCLGKMRDVSSKGRTILFVSHSMAAVSALCTRAVFLRNGQLAAEGTTSEVIAAYQADSPERLNDSVDVREMPRTGSGKAKFYAVDLQPVDKLGNPLSAATPGCDLVLTLALECYINVVTANVAVEIYDKTGYRLIDVNTAIRGEFLSLDPGGRAVITFTLRNLRLKPGAYSVSAYVGRANVEEIDHVHGARILEVIGSGVVVHSEEFPGPYQCEFTHTTAVL